MNAPREIQFNTAAGKRLFDLLVEACEGFDTTDVLEAAAVILAQNIAQGSSTLDDAETVVRELADAMFGDITNSWPAVLAIRARRRQ